MNSMIDNEDKILQNLKDAGCTDEFVEEFFEIRKRGDMKALIQLLYKHKTQLLNSLHDFQKKIDCLDYLIFQINQPIPSQKEN